MVSRKKALASGIGQSQILKSKLENERALRCGGKCPFGAAGHQMQWKNHSVRFETPAGNGSL